MEDLAPHDTAKRLAGHARDCQTVAVTSAVQPQVIESEIRFHFHETAPEFTLLEPVSAFDFTAVAEETTENLLAAIPGKKAVNA